MSDRPETNADRFAARVGPHLRVGEVTMRYDIGDETARRHGEPMVATACDREVVSTLTTRRRDLVRCPACRAAVELRDEPIDAGEASAVSPEQDTKETT